MKDDEWDALTQKQKQAQLAKMRADQRKHEARINKALSGMALFVRAHPHAVIEVAGDVAMRAGQISRYVLRIEVDEERFQRFQAERKARAAK